MSGRITRAVASVAVGAILSAGWQVAERVERRPLEKRGTPFDSPRTWELRERIDPATGRPERYDPRPTITPVDSRAGVYDLSWIGVDGEAKSVRYQRPDAAVVVVRAEVRDVPGDLLEYTYYVESSAESGQELRGFEVQTFSTEVTPLVQGLAGGWMAPGLLGPGRWWRFWVGRDFSPAVAPGETGVFRLRSRALPGLVDCAVDGGTGGYKGVGEDMPSELEALLPSYAAWPRGKTVGPIDRLSSLTPDARRGQLLDWLSEFQRLGWITVATRQRYESMLRDTGVVGLVNTLDADLNRTQITAEVAAIVRGLAR